MKKFTIHTMGCKSNQFEESIIRNNLLSNGYIEVKKAEEADIYILNSCSVTHKSDNEAFYLLRNAKHKNPNIINILTGCIAQIEKENLLDNGYIDYVVGNTDKLNFSETLQKLQKTTKKISVANIMEDKNFTYFPISDTAKTRATLKIQDGCNNRCAYCIIPYARGNSRSAEPKFVIQQIKKLEHYGFKEIVFTGIHIGLWGNEFNQTLLDLLELVEAETNISRYRLGSLYPNEIDEKLLYFLSKSTRFCPHFHLSLQTVCDRTLRSMNRKYTVKESIELISEINSRFDLPFIGADIITGFAGETSEDFDITVKNLELSELSNIHTFPYSIRKGTAGATLKNQIPESIKNQRAAIVKEISAKKYIEFINKNIGKTRKILVEKNPDKTTGCLKAVTDNYLTVCLNSKDTSLLNTNAEAFISEFRQGKLFAQIK